MLKKLNSWKDKLIDIVTNVSLKNVKVSKASFRVFTFIFSISLICIIVSISIFSNMISSHAATPSFTRKYKYSTILGDTEVSTVTESWDQSTGTYTISGYGTIGPIWDLRGTTGLTLITKTHKDFSDEIKHLVLRGNSSSQKIILKGNFNGYFGNGLFVTNGCKNLESIEIQNVDFTQAGNGNYSAPSFPEIKDDINNMFASKKTVKSLSFDNISFSNGTSASQFFAGIDVSSLDLSKVHATGKGNYSGFISYCSNLTEILLSYDFSTENCIDGKTIALPYKVNDPHRFISEWHGFDKQGNDLGTVYTELPKKVGENVGELYKLVRIDDDTVLYSDYVISPPSTTYKIYCKDRVIDQDGNVVIDSNGINVFEFSGPGHEGELTAYFYEDGQVVYAGTNSENQIKFTADNNPIKGYNSGTVAFPNGHTHAITKASCAYGGFKPKYLDRIFEDANSLVEVEYCVLAFFDLDFLVPDDGVICSGYLNASNLESCNDMYVGANNINRFCCAYYTVGYDMITLPNYPNNWYKATGTHQISPEATLPASNLNSYGAGYYECFDTVVELPTCIYECDGVRYYPEFVLDEDYLVHPTISFVKKYDLGANYTTGAINDDVRAYLYSDGLVVLEGTGFVKQFNTLSSVLTTDGKEGDVTKIAFSKDPDYPFYPIGYFDYFFANLPNLTDFDKTNFNAGGITSCLCLFTGSFDPNANVELDLSGLDFSLCSSFGSMFWSANIKKLNISNWILSATQSSTRSFTNLCGSIDPVPMIEEIDMSNWTNGTSFKPYPSSKIMGSATSLKKINLSETDFGNANFYDGVSTIADNVLPISMEVNSEIILPKSVGVNNIKLPELTDATWKGCNEAGRVIDDSAVYTNLVAKNSSIGLVKLVAKPNYRILYTELDGTEYYEDGTSDTSITLSNSFDLTDTSGTHSSPAGSLMAYLYSNGLMIFDGEGDIVTSTPYANNSTVKNAVRKIVMSSYGFKPCGELDNCFSKMQNVTTIDLTNIDTQNVTSFCEMFYNDTSLTTIIGISDLDTRNLKYFYYMFRNCYVLTGTLDLHHDSTRPNVWDISHVINGSNETELLYIFGNLGKDGDGVDLNLSGWNFNSSSLIRIQYSFEGAKLTNLDISGWANTNRLSNIYGAFDQCIYLGDTLDLSSLHLTHNNMSNGSLADFFLNFAATSNLNTIILPSELNTGANINLPYASNTDGAWVGYKADGITKVGGKFNKLAAARTGSGEDGLYQVKFVNDTLRELDKLGTNGEPDSSLGKIKYKTTGTNDTSVTLIDSYDLSDTANGETAGSICAYIYSDGTMIFDGEGAVKTYANIGKVPWREDKKISFVTRIVMSNNGFKPYGSIAGFFSPTEYTAYGPTIDGHICNGIDKGCSQIRSIDLTGFDSSEVTNMAALFLNCSTLNKQIIGIENLDTSKVTDMHNMFKYVCVRRNSVRFTGYDSEGKSIYDTSIGHDKDFLELDLHTHTDSVSGKKYWDVSSVTNFDSMFGTGYIKSLDISNWEMNSSVPDHSITFSHFTDGLHAGNGFNIRGWTNTEKINYSNMFDYLYSVRTLDLSDFKFDYDCTDMFGTNDMFINTIILPDEGNITNNAQVYLYKEYGSYNHRSVWVACNQSGGRVEGLNPIRCKDYMITKYDADGDESYTGPNDIYQLKRVEDKLYQGKILDADGNPDSTLGSINYFRNGAEAKSADGTSYSVPLATYDDDNNPGTPEVSCVWDISSAQNGTINAYLFSDGMMIFDGEGGINTYNDFSLTAKTPILPWESTNNAVRKNVKKIVGSINKFKPSGSLSFYFCNMPNLNTFDGTNFDVTNIISMANMFNMSGVITCNMKNWNTNRVTSTSQMFDIASRLTNLDMTGCSFTNLSNAGLMFSNATSLENLDLSSWNTTLTTVFGMFNNTINLTNLNLGDNITLNVDDIHSMFHNTKLSEVDFTKFKVANPKKVINNIKTVIASSAITKVDFTGLDFSNVTNANSEFFKDDGGVTAGNLIEIILPDSVPSEASGVKIPLQKINDLLVWYGYDKFGTKVSDVPYKYMPARVGDNALELYELKSEKEILYTDSNNIDYYRDSTSDTSASPITRVKVYDLTDTSGTRGDSANTVRAYLYSNGLMILDGEGDINAYTSSEDVPWRKDSNLHTITKVVGSNNGFIPHGSMAYYFDMTCDTTYYVKDSGNVNVSENRVIDNFTCIDFTNIDTSNVTSFKNLLSCCDKLNQAIGVENLITDNVTDMSNMFSYTESLGGLDLSTHTDNSDPLHPITYWNVSKVTKFISMFQGASNRTAPIKLDNWVLNPNENVSISSMFYFNHHKGISFANWSNTTSISDVNYFLAIPTNANDFDFSGWKLTNTSLVSSRLFGVSSNDYVRKIILPDEIKDGCIFPLPVKTHEGWFEYTSDELTMISDTPVVNLVAKNTSTGLAKLIRVQDILHTDSNGVKYYRDGTSDNTITLAKYDSNGDGTDNTDCIWDLSMNNDNSIRAYLYTNGLLILDGTGEITEYTYYTYNNIPWRVYQKEHLITKVVGSNRGFKPIGSMAYLFFMNKYDTGTGYLDNESLNTVDFTNIDTSEVTSFEYLFYYCEHLSNLIGISNLDTHNVTSMQAMFNVCHSLTSLDLHHDSARPNVWDVSNVTKFSSMFSNLGSNTNNVNINLSGWTLNSSNDISAYYMFQFSHIDNINLTGTTFTNKLKDIKSMFWYTYLKNPLDLSKFNFTNSSLTYDDDTLKIDLNNLNTYTNTIILPESDKLLADANLKLPTKTDYAWFGYDSSGNRLSEKTYTTLPKQGDDPNLYQIKLEGSALFTIDGKKYYATDLLYKWDVSEIGDEGNIYAYAFKDNAGNVTVVFDDVSTDINDHYMMTFNNYEGYPTHDANLDTYTMDEYFDRKLYRNSISFTPWSILNTYASTKSLNGVTEFKFNTPIHFKDSKYLFSGTNCASFVIDDNFLFEPSDSSNTYDHYVMFKVDLDVPVTLKVTRDIPYFDFGYYFTDELLDDVINTVDLSGITITNSDYEDASGIVVDKTRKVIYLPEHLVGFDSDADKEKLKFDSNYILFEVYNDNGTKLNDSDDIFLGYTDSLIDTHCILYKDNLGNTVYPTYIKETYFQDVLPIIYIQLYNLFVDGKFVSGQDRQDAIINGDTELLLDIAFANYQMLEEYAQDPSYWPLILITDSYDPLFDDSSFNGLFKGSDFRDECRSYTQNFDSYQGMDFENFFRDLFEFIKDDRVDLGLSPKISYSSYENKFTYDNDTNELGYFKKVANKFISELFNKELINDNNVTVLNYMDDIVLYVDSVLDSAYRFFSNWNEAKDTSDNLIFLNILEDEDDDCAGGVELACDLIGDISVKALNKYFTKFNIKPTLKDDGSGNEIDNEYTYKLKINKLDLSDTNTNVVVSSVAPQLLADPPVQIKPSVTVTYNNNAGVPITLTLDDDYTLSYGNNNVSGTNSGSITINSNGTTTTGSRTIYFDINDSFIKLNINNLVLGNYGSIDEKEIIKYKDGTNNRVPEDITSFTASELHPYIVYNDGTNDNYIYLDYDKAYITDASGNPIFSAGENESTNPKTKRNVKFEGLKLKDSDSSVFKLFASDLTTEISSTNNNDSYIINNVMYLLDNTKPTVSAISKDASVTSPLSYNDELILNVIFSEELKSPIDKNDITLTYQIGNLIDDTNFVLSIKEDSDITYSDSDHKTIIKFTGTIPSDIGLIIDSQIKLKELLINDLVILEDISGNELDKNIVNKFTDNILVNTLEDYSKNLLDDIDIFDPDVTNSDIEKAMIAYEKLSPSDKDAINGSNYVNVLNKKYYGDDSDRTTYPGLVVPGEKDVTNIDGNDNESVEVFGTVSALEDKYSYKIILRVDKITDSNEIKDIETKLKNKVSLYKQDEENLSSYRIKLVDSNTGNEVEPDLTDKILVRLEVPYEIFSKINALYHILDDDSVETLLPLEKGKYNVFDGTNYVDKYYIYFETNSFSSFTLTMLTGIIPSPDPDPEPTPDPKPISTQTITVQTIKNNSYIDGYKDGTFKPEDNITRGEFSKILASISNNYSDSNKLDYSRYINSYKDVSTNDWYSSYIGFNNKKQVMVGYNDMTFKPNKAITRAEAAKALTNMYNITTNNNISDTNNNANTFNRELNGKWYENSMKKLINAGLLKGYPDGTIRPNDPITRAEIVALINRVTNRDMTNNFIKNSNIKVSDVSKDKWYYNDIVSAMLDY